MQKTQLFLILCFLFSGCITSKAQNKWVRTDLSALTYKDQIVIVDLKTKRAMSNDKGSSDSPAAVEVTISADSTQLTGDIPDRIKWNVYHTAKSAKEYIFCPNGTNKKWLYRTNKNSLVVGSSGSNVFTFYTEPSYVGLSNGDVLLAVNMKTNNWSVYEKSSYYTGTILAYFKLITSTTTSLKVADSDKTFLQGQTGETVRELQRS